MKQTFIKTRLKQRKKYIVKIALISIPALVLIAYVTYNYISQFKTDSPEETTSQETDNTYNICFTNEIPTQIQESLQKIDLTDVKEDNEITYNQTETKCNTHITRNITDDTNYERVWSKIYVVAARFDAPIHEISQTEIDQLITNQSLDTFTVIWDAQETDKFIKSKYETTVGQEYQTPTQVLDHLLTTTQALAVVPFEEITPAYKILQIAGISPTQKDFNRNIYPLTDTYWISSENTQLGTTLRISLKRILGEENYKEDNIYDIVMSGSSNIGARNYYTNTETQQDPIYPIRGIADTLKTAEIAHISNETAFTNDCTQTANTTKLCGHTDTFAQLTFAGIDIVDVSGNHILDISRSAFNNTLDLYSSNNIHYIGGGSNYDDGHTPRIITIGKIKIAFLGYNAAPPYSYNLGQTYSGNTTYSTNLMIQDLKQAKELADFIIVDLQVGNEQSKNVTTNQEEYAQAAIDNGADIVNGVHPRYIQPIVYTDNGIIFHSLGNTLYDNPEDIMQREGLLVRHIFYGEKYIGFDLIPTNISTSLQTELAEDDQKARILEQVYSISEINIK